MPMPMQWRAFEPYGPEASTKADEDFIISGDILVSTCRSTQLYDAFIFKHISSKNCFKYAFVVYKL